jgi:hypothetical protein
MIAERYMQPIAVHRTHAEHLLLHDAEGRYHLWKGEPETEPVAIPQALAHYLMHRREMQVLEARQRMWFVIADLPTRQVATANPAISEQQFPL